MIRLPIEPLRRVMTTRRIIVHHLPENLERDYLRSVQRGWISDKAADRICIKYLDLQPELLWPDEWRQDDDE